MLLSLRSRRAPSEKMLTRVFCGMEKIVKFEERRVAGHRPHHPEIDWAAADAFNKRLNALGGAWNTTGRSFLHDGTSDLIRLQWIIPDEKWCREEGMLQFLDDPLHRQIIRWFLLPSPHTEGEMGRVDEQRWKNAAWEPPHRRIWEKAELLQKMGVQGNNDRLQEILHFLEVQDYIVSRGKERWTSGSALSSVQNLGSTMEWLVQAHLRNRYQALTRRCVHFSAWEALKLNDLDILAFIDDLIVIAECKSGTDAKTDQVARFVQRAQRFPADIAIFMVDTVKASYVRKYARFMQQFLGETQPFAQEHDWQEEGLILFLSPNIYVSNTGQSIQGMLDHVIELGLQRKRASS